MPILENLFSEKKEADNRITSMLDAIQRSLYERFLVKITLQHREHIVLEFCDQVSIEMQAKLFEETILSTIQSVSDSLPSCCSEDKSGSALMKTTSTAVGGGEGDASKQ